MLSAIIKWGNSQGIRIPKTILKDANMDSNEAVEMFVENDTIVIKKAALSRARPQQTLDERFAGFSGTYEVAEVDWGEPVGDEVW